MKGNRVRGVRHPEAMACWSVILAQLLNLLQPVFCFVDVAGADDISVISTNEEVPWGCYLVLLLSKQFPKRVKFRPGAFGQQGVDMAWRLGVGSCSKEKARWERRDSQVGHSGCQCEVTQSSPGILLLSSDPS